MTNYDKMAKGNDRVLKDLAIIVMSEQTGSRWMANAAQTAIEEIERLRIERPSFQPENVRAWMLATPFTQCSEWKSYVDHMLASINQQTRKEA